jgi:hypothetical protein
MDLRYRMMWVGTLSVAGLIAVSGCGSNAPSTPGLGSTTGATSQGVTGPAASGQGGTAGQATSAAAGAPNPTATESNPAGDIPDTQAFVAYSPPGKHLTVKVPEGWARTTAGTAVIFTDKYNSIRIDTVPASAAPTTASAQGTEVPTIRASEHGFSPGTVKTVQRTSGPAILITYRADSAANPVTGKVAIEAVERYEFWKNGVEAVLTLAAPVGSDNVDPWRAVTDSFSWQP